VKKVSVAVDKPKAGSREGQGQSLQIFQDLCRVTLEVPSAEDIVKALKWILAKEKMERDLDLDSAIKITYFTLSQCSDTQCYRTFDRFTIVDVRGAEIADNFKKIDERGWKHVIVAIPKKFGYAQVVLRHENEYGVHYHVIYRSSVIEGTVNGWKETIVYE
jgi:hypothetical protein